MTTSEVERLTRATTRPYPGAYFFIDNTKIIVWSANFIIQYTGNAIVKKLKDGYIVPVDFEIITDI